MRTIKKIFNTTVSVKEGASRNVLRGIIQYDTLNEVNIRLSDGSKAFDYTGYTNIIFKVLKADGTAYIDSEGENVIATSPVDGIITVNLTGQATTAAGLCQSVIEVYAGEDKMTTARFNYEVFEKLDLDETIESTSEYPVLQKLVADLSVLEESIETTKAGALPVGVVTQVFYSANAEEEDARLLEVFNAMPNRTVAFVVSRHSTGFLPFGGGALLISIYRAAVDYGTIDVRCYSSDGVYRGVAGMRDINKGVLGEWEFVNPPMLEGVEYRTTERHFGRPVYTKMLAYNALPTDGTDVNLPITTDEAVINAWISHMVCSNNRGINKFPSGDGVPSVEIAEDNYDNANAYVKISNTGKLIGYSGNVTVKYTKATDT